MIEKLYKRDDALESVKAVTPNRCNRCNGSNIYQDVEGQYHCLDCFEYGSVNDTMTLYRYQRRLPEKTHILEMDYELTEKQKKGSSFLLDCYKAKKSGFLQAVCGAGKTEMTYEVILNALNDNLRVCIVIPRVAVLKELFKRFKSNFTCTEIGTIYEGRKQYETANLILSTPQQLIYFYKEFDVIIVDEIDAYPFAGNKFLDRILKKSLRRNGVLLYMSATISDEYQKQIDNKTLRHHLIPSRFHQKPLTIPEFKRITSKKNLMDEIVKLTKGTRQTLLYIPTLELGKQYLFSLRQLSIETDFISSKTIDKKTPINRFRRAEIRVLITTTILERGVTFQDIDCVVVMSDHKVFTKSTLIQIAGRVGRLSEFNPGQVIFYSQYVSKEMKDARKEIIWMNKQNEMPNL